jgi:hypothetical protein
VRRNYAILQNVASSVLRVPRPNPGRLDGELLSVCYFHVEMYEKVCWVCGRFMVKH